MAIYPQNTQHLKVQTEEREYLTKFELDPMKCFNSGAELNFEEVDANTLLVNLTNDMVANEKLFDPHCLWDSDQFWTLKNSA